jgi:hypothetical protein
MATPAQLAANRANAQRSTGPRSVEGKSVSSLNALKHGVDAAAIALPGEDPAAYQALADGYTKLYQPQTVMHRFLVDSMIRADWHKQRLQRLESDLIRKLLAESPDASLLDVMLSDSPGGKLLARTQRQITAHERAWFRAHRELTRMAENLAAAEEPMEIAEPVEPSQPINSKLPERTQFPEREPAKQWPPLDEKTGKPLFFVG